jgi:single-stranded-DNA-specific exonuclease
MEKRWKLLPADAQKTESLQKALGISPVLCRILVSRGIDHFEAARQFFRPSMEDLHNPWSMKDMELAVDRILTAFHRKEKILVYGDYDVDGTTSVAMVYQFLLNIYPSELVDFYIPHRYREGYGISRQGIDFAKDQGFSLIISLDCGIKSAELIRYAMDLGIEFIVCDHHLPDSALPPAVAILNPKQPGCPYPYKELCGCGVGLKLLAALADKFGLPQESWRCYLDLVATAIAADIVPVTGENRILAFYGLKRVNESPCPGIRALMELGGLKNGPLQMNNLVFVIAPRVNAAGRMDDARKAVKLFLEQDYQRALVLAGQLHSDNSDRKEADLSITEEALALLGAEDPGESRKTTVVYQPHWHKGVVGIVASRLIDRYYRPTVVLTNSGEIVSGSARSVRGFNLYEAVHACRDHLLGYGGHFAAAGMTLLPSEVENFRQKFEAVVAASITEDQLVPEIQVDAEINFTEIQDSLHRILTQMEPFGPENMRPVFWSRDVSDTGASRIVKEDHLRFSLRQSGVTLNGIGFGLAGRFPLLAGNQKVDILFNIDENEWNGKKSLQLKVIDLRPATRL